MPTIGQTFLSKLTGFEGETTDFPLFKNPFEQDDIVMKKLTVKPNTSVPVKKTINLNDFMKRSADLGYDAPKIHEEYVKLRGKGVDVPGYEEAHSELLRGKLLVDQKKKRLRELEAQMKANEPKQEETKPGFLERTGKALGERGVSLLETASKVAPGKISPIEFAVRTVGDVVGGVGDVAFEGLRSAYDNLAPGSVKKGVDAVITSDVGQSGLKALAGGMESWDNWKNSSETTKRAGEFLEGALNIGSLFIPGPKQATKLIGKGTSAVAKGTANFSKNILAKVSGLSRETIDNIISDVGEFTKAKIGDTNVYDLKTKLIEGVSEAKKELGDINKHYSSLIKETPDKFDIKDVISNFIDKLSERQVGIKKRKLDKAAISNFIDKLGERQVGAKILKLDSAGKIDGKTTNFINKLGKRQAGLKNVKLDFSGKTAISNEADQNVLKKALSELNKFGKTPNNVQELLNLRQSIDGLVDWKNPVSDKTQSVLKGIRSDIDNKIKALPGFKELDESYKGQLEFIKNLEKDLYTAGQEKNNIFSVIRNITNKGNEKRLERMETLLPGITKKIKALKSVEDIENLHKVGTYVASLAGGAGLTYATGNPAALAIGLLALPGVTPAILTNYAKTKNFIKGLGKGALDQIDKAGLKIQEIIGDTGEVIKEAYSKSSGFSGKKKGIVDIDVLTTGKSKTFDEAGNLVKGSDDLISEAKKYKSAEEFMESIFNKRAEKQRGWSAPSGKGETLEERLSYDGDVTLREELTKHIKQPDDYFHGYLGPKKYGNDSNTITAIKKGMSEGEITIYRAVPKNINTWRDGDWVYFVKDKAKIHGDISLDGNYHIIEKKVPIDDVWWDGNDINEWGYDSGLEKEQLKQIYEQAHKK